MTSTFRRTEELLDALADRSFERPPALVANAHVTGLGVARALAAADVPVVAVDRSPDGVAPPSTAVDFAGRVAYPLDDPDGFEADLAAVVDAVGRDIVAFGCMDEWVRAFAAADVDGLRRPFSGPEPMDRVLDKESLYATAEELDVPYPETYRLAETDPGRAAEELGFPLVVKPARKREFEEAIGTNVVEVDDEAAFETVLSAVRDAGVQVMAQERIDVERGQDHSVGSYVPPGGADDALALVANPTVRYPPSFGTSTLVETAERPALRDRALGVLEACGYHGISEAEFVYDVDRGEFLLLDINTRPWKWIGLPVAAGLNLPLAAYASVTDLRYEPDPAADARWVYLRDYLELQATTEGVRDRLDRETWRRLLSGAFEDRDDLTTGVYRPSDPGPAAKLLATAFADREYYCAC